MFNAQCRSEAFAIVGIHAFTHKTANASPLLFKKLNCYEIVYLVDTLRFIHPCNKTCQKCK